MTKHININLENDLAQSFDVLTKKRAINKSALIRGWIVDWVIENKGDVKNDG